VYLGIKNGNKYIVFYLFFFSLNKKINKFLFILKIRINLMSSEEEDESVIGTKE